MQCQFHSFSRVCSKNVDHISICQVVHTTYLKGYLSQSIINGLEEKNRREDWHFAYTSRVNDYLSCDICSTIASTIPTSPLAICEAVLAWYAFHFAVSESESPPLGSSRWLYHLHLPSCVILHIRHEICCVRGRLPFPTGCGLFLDFASCFKPTRSSRVGRVL